MHKHTKMYANNSQLKSIIDYVVCKQKTKVKIKDKIAKRGAEVNTGNYLLREK